MTAQQTNAITDPQSIIAALQQRLDAAMPEKVMLAEELAARTAELAQRNSEYGERIEQQSATIDVLKVMSASPGDPQPVFDLITQRARELCNASLVGLLQLDGDLLQLRSSSRSNATALATMSAQFPTPLSRGIAACRAILDKQIIHIRDVDADPDLSQAIRNSGSKSIVSLPLMRDDMAVGAIAMNGMESGGFSDDQIALLQTFAEQAVIAIGSAETYRALQTRTADLQESLEYQTATSDVLKVISRSTFDLQPVLDTLVETAARLCDADMAGIGRREGGLVRGVAFFGYPPEYGAWIKSLGAMPLDKHIVGHRAALEGRVVHVHDIAADPNYPTGSITLGKMRTSLGVPLLREGESIGSIVTRSSGGGAIHRTSD